MAKYRSKTVQGVRHCVVGITPAFCFHSLADARRYIRAVRKGVKAGGGRVGGIKIERRDYR